MYRAAREGVLEVAGRARGAHGGMAEVVLPHQPAPPAQRAPARLAPGRQEAACQPVLRPGGTDRGTCHRPRPTGRGARWNSPRSTWVARTGGPWASRRPAPPNCSTANSRPTVALVFAQALPGGVEPGTNDSSSYAQWLRQQADAKSATAAPEYCPFAKPNVGSLIGCGGERSSGASGGLAASSPTVGRAFECRVDDRGNGQFRVTGRSLRGAV